MTRTRASRVGPGTTECRRRRAWTTALLDNRAFRLDQIERLQSELEPGDRSALAEVSRALLVAAQLSLQATQDALDRLEAGTFGICASCQRPVELQLLDALPMSDRCSSCLNHLDRGDPLEDAGHLGQGERTWSVQSLLLATGQDGTAGLVSRS